jgi:hypothetical protein
VLKRVWLTCVLVVAPATAWAQSSDQTRTVEVAQHQVTSATQKLTQLQAQRAQLAGKLAQQVAAVDSLKKQKASWRRDRALNTAQAAANDTATRLTALDKNLAAAQRALANARRTEVAAIDAEIKAGAAGARADQLAKLRAQLVPAPIAPKKIVIPDAEIDPLADPDELERQVAAIVAAEKQLELQRKTLDQQHEDLVVVAELRQAHERTAELSTRDDDQPHRGAQSSSRGTNAETASPTAGASNDSAGGAGQGSGGSPTSGGTTGGGGDFGADTKGTTSSGFESSAAVALGEVIDRSTIDGMLRAQRSGDPKQRAEAAARARDAVAKRLELLKKKRAMIEARAKELRSK